MVALARTAFAGGGVRRGPSSRAFAARYENAQFGDQQTRQWWMADYFSPKAANNYQVRRILRMRSRQEVSNNPYLFGICLDNANDLIGTGPTLKLNTPSTKYNREVESAFAEWWAEVDGIDKVRTCKLARTIDGEGFLVLRTVEDMEDPVKLYPCDLEADQVTTPQPGNLADWWVDGMTLHKVTGKPTHYHVLRHHPGDFYFPDFNPLSVDKYPARYVIHWFPKFRPGQVRGVPIFTPSLDLFIELRDFRRAVLEAANTAARHAAVLKSSGTNGTPADPSDEEEGWANWEAIPIERGVQVVLPAGFEMQQFKPEHPTTSYEMFQTICLGEACRPLGYPLVSALGSSQKFNFSSSRLDLLNYRSGLTVERGRCEFVVLDPLFKAWYEEAVLVGRIRPYDGLTKVPPHVWHWPGWEPLDPIAEAQADQIRQAAGQDTYQGFWGRRGFDWRDVMAQQAEERKLMKQLDLVFGEPLKKSVTETRDERDDPVKARKFGKGDSAVEREIFNAV